MRPAILAPSDIHVLLERTARFSDLLFTSAARTDDAASIDAELWTAFRQTGLGMAAFPEAMGGIGLLEPARYGTLCSVLRLLGAGDLSVARLFEGHVNAVSLVCRFGTPAQAQDLQQSIETGTLSAVWGADDANGLKLVAEESETRLTGRKILCSGAGFVTRPLVTASSLNGQVLCLLRLDRGYPADLTQWQAQGMRSTATGSVDLSGLRINADNLIGAAGDFMQQPYFSAGAWRFCAAHLGAAERLVDLFREHLVSRGRGDDPYQLQRLAVAAAAVKTARFWIEEAARRLADDEHDAASVVAFANLTRMVTERSALDVMEAVQRGVGLAAFVRPNPIERICRDLSTYLRQPVPDLAMNDGARALLASPLCVGNF